ncbi:unnamed protein product [Paramecium pentaurelia]|uniref:Transmembrane protein n=1 Tax=Paramecium pentaurelia TaxID=43138 RepID=A0A8S1Y9W2_9CILI|nr:unnamed protein product [Paramecium pentaurelia]
MGTVIAIFDYAIAGLRMIVNDMNEWIKIECKSQLYYQSGVTKKFYIIQLLIRSKLMFCQVLVFISIQLILIVASSFLKAFIKKFKTKQEVFKQLVKINKPQTNKNSFIFITKLTGKTNRANLYYWNKFSLCSSRLDIETSYQKILDIPINYRQDIIICYHNPQFRVSQRIKKKIGIVKDIPGFIYNINALYKMKPFKNKYERIRTIEGIEKVMKLGTNVPMVKNKRRIQSTQTFVRFHRQWSSREYESASQ